MMTPNSYAGLMVGVVFLWPFLLSDAVSSLVLAAAVVANTCLAIYTWWMCSSGDYSYWLGLKVVAANQMTGCANVTLLFLMFVYPAVYLLSICYALIGAVCGREWSQYRWMRLTESAFRI